MEFTGFILLNYDLYLGLLMLIGELEKQASSQIIFEKGFLRQQDLYLLI